MSRLRRRLLWRTGLALGVGGLALVGLGVSLHAFIDQAAHATHGGDGLLLGLGVAAFAVATALAGPRFQAMVPLEDRHRLPSTFALGRLFLAANALNLVLPGPAGDVALASWLDRRHGLAVERGVAVSLHARLVGLAVTGLLAVGCALTLPLPHAVTPLLVAGVGLLGVLGSTAGLVAARPKGLLQVGERLGLRRWSAVHTRVVKVVEALEAVRASRPRAWLEAAAWSLLIQGFVFVALLASTGAVGITAPLPSLLLTHATGGLAAIGAVALPAGGAGAYEVGFVAVLAGSSPLGAVEAGLVLMGMRLVQLLVIGLSSAVLLAGTPQLLREPAPI